MEVTFIILLVICPTDKFTPDSNDVKLSWYFVFKIFFTAYCHLIQATPCLTRKKIYIVVGTRMFPCQWMHEAST